MRTRYTEWQLGAAFLLWSFISQVGVGAAEPKGNEGARAMFHAAEADWSRQKWNDAIAKFKQTAEQFPNDPMGLDAQCHYAECLSYVSPPETAITEYEKVVRQAPGSPEAHEAQCGIAALKYWLGQTQEAHDLFEQVARETKDWATLKECIGRMKLIQRLLDLEKHNPGVLAKDCGPKAFTELCRLRGIELKDRELGRLLPVGPRGVTLEAMRNAGRAKGMKLIGARLNGIQLRTAAKPFIAHLRNNHYCVVTDVRGSRIDFIDPHGRETYTSTNRFHVLWDGAALVPEGGVAGLMKSQLMSKAAMKNIYGGHHLHGNEDGGCEENPASGCDNGGCGGAGLPTWQVNMANYNFLIRDLVFSYAGRGPAVELRLTYSADSTIVSAFGRGWTHNYNVFLRENPNGVDVRRGGAKVDHFISRGDGSYTPPLWNYDELRKNTNTGTYTLFLKRSKQTQHFNPQGQLTHIEDRNGNAVTLQYDADRLRTITDAVGRVTTFNYDGNGRISEVIDPLGRRAGYQYDVVGNLRTYIDMAGNAITYTYDEVSYMTSYTTPQGTWHVRRGTTPNFSEFPYILKEVIDPLGRSRKYDTGPTIAWIDDARTNRWFVFSAGAGETTLVTDPEGNSTRQSFSSGNLTQIIDPKGHTTTMTYDARGNVTSVTDSLGTIVRYQYDARDNLVKAIAPLNRTNTYVYDARDNLLQSIDAQTGITTFTVDSFGEVRTITDPSSNTVRYDYDPHGNVTNMVAPTGQTTRYAFDAVGRVTSMTDPNGQTFLYSIDPIDRMTEVHGPAGVLMRYGYECCTLSSVSDAVGTLGFAHDATGRLLRFTNTFGQVIQYDYDGNDNLTALSYPGNKVVRYEYDRANRMTKVTDWLGHTTRYQYDAAGNLVLATNSNGTVTRYSYDVGDRLASQVAAQKDGAVLAAYRLAFDAQGNRTNQLAVRTLLPALASTTNAARFDADNRIVSGGANTFTHDNNGNLTGIHGPRPSTLRYDPLDRLIEVVLPQSTVQYSYDALGDRRTRTVNGRTSRLVIDPSGYLPRLLGETDEAGNITAYYVYGLELRSRITPAGQSYFYHFDALSSTVALTDAAGNALNKYAYDPDGTMSPNSIEAVANTFRFGGAYGVQDEDNGLLYMRARYYLPQIARFLNKDPIGFAGGPHLYQYAEGNPVNLIDPGGNLAFIPILIGIGVGAGFDLGLQLFLNGGRWDCVNWGDVAIAGALGGLGGEFFSGWRWMKNARGFEKAWTKNFRTGWHRLPPGKYPGAGRNLPHYHRRPGIGKHRPWQGW